MELRKFPERIIQTYKAGTTQSLQFTYIKFISKSKKADPGITDTIIPDDFDNDDESEVNYYESIL